MEDMNDVQNIETVSEGKQYIVVRIEIGRASCRERV